MKDGFVKIAAATAKVRVADTEFNAESVCSAMIAAAGKGAKIAVFPELCLTGATCGDLFYQSTLLNGALDALAKVCGASCGLDMLTVVGLPVSAKGKLYDCAAVVYEGEVLGLVPKILSGGCFASGAGIRAESIELFGEETFFGTKLLFEHCNMPSLVLGAEIGSDLYAPIPPAAGLSLAGATVIAVPAADAATVTSGHKRRLFLMSESAKYKCAFAAANAGDGESTGDEVYCGHDIITENGAILCEGANGIGTDDIDVSLLDHERRRAGLFGDDRGFARILWGGELAETNLERSYAKNPFVPEDEAELSRRCAAILDIQSAGLRKRMEHTFSKKLVVGVSGGLDSTLAMIVSAKALQELGRESSDLIAVTMPGFGTTKRTRSNADLLAERLGAELRVVSIADAVSGHFADIGHDSSVHDSVYENAQARERTQVLMDIANGCGGMVVGTGDISELALGWATYNGDHMSMYGVNGGIPKTLIRHVVGWYAENCGDGELSRVLRDVLDTPVSPELLPAKDGEISQKTEDLVGPYELHDFYLYYIVRCGFEPKKVLRLAKYVFAGEYDDETILKWLRTFCRRFFNQQFKRSCLPDGPKVGSLSISPRGGLAMPSDAVSALWLKQLD